MRAWIGKNREVSLYLALTVASVIIIGAMLFALRSATELHDTLYPLADASMELAIEASLAHMYLEQGVTKDDSVELEKSWYHLDRLDKYALAMLEGGTVDNLYFRPVGSAELRHRITYLRTVIMQYRTAALARLDSDPQSQAGLANRAVHEDVFRELMERTAEAEAEFRRQMTNDITNFRHAKIAIIAVTLIFSLLAAFAFHKYMVERKRDEQRILHLNLVLRAVRNVSHLITVEKDKSALLKRTCDLLVETRGFHNAWITLVDEHGKPKLYAEAGLKEQFSRAREYLDRGRLLPCCVRVKDLQGLLAIENPIAECAECPLAQQYTGRGGMAVRLEHNNILYGFLVVSTPRVYVTSIEERSLLQEIADDIALTVHLLAVEDKRLETEKALRESETRYRNLFELAGDAIFLMDEERFIDCNARALQLCGCSKEMMLGSSLLGCSPERQPDGSASSAILRERTERAWKGESVFMEWRLTKRDGGVIDAEINLSRIDMGRTHCLLATVRDVTERRKAEKALAASEEKYRNLAEGLDQVIYRADPVNFTDQYVNKAIEKIYGYTAEEWYENPQLWFERVYPEDKEWVKDGYSKLYAEGKSNTAEYRIVRKDGTVRWVEDRVGFEKDENGKAIAVCGVLTDITERKRAQEILRASEQRFQDIALSSADWIWEMDMEDRYVFASGRVKQLLGYEPEELIGKTPYDFMPDHERQRVATVLSDAKRSRSPIVNLERPITTKDGSEVCVLSNAVPIFDPSDNLIGYRGVTRDITKQKRAEKEIAQYTAQLEKANIELKKSKGELEEFIYTVSHDLKAPVVSISGFTGLISQQAHEKLDKTSSKYLQRIAANAEVMERLIADLLELSRIGRMDGEMSRVNTNDLLTEVFDAFSVAAQGRKIVLSKNGALPDIYGWRDRVRQMLSNLIDNAIKYMPIREDAQVRVGFDSNIQCPNGCSGAFYVSDNGSGVPTEFRHKLFQAFQRIQQDGVEVEGNGVGLSIVKRIAEAHGGQVWFDAGGDGGATFYINLPLADERSELTGTEADALPGEKSHRNL
ncbi:MAG: PAS domain S-box protein [Candidatus Zixiibacteriota bacterium]